MDQNQSAMHETFQLPSKMKLKFRKLMLHDESVLADAMNDKRADIEETIEQIVTSCVVSVVDPGPYTKLKEGDSLTQRSWLEILRGDYFCACLKLREMSYRDRGKIDVDLKCDAGGTCKHEFAVEVDISNDLIYQELPEESFNRLREGKSFETIVAGRKVQFMLSMGKSQHLARKYMEQYSGRTMAAGLRSRIISVEGVESRDIMDWLDGQGKNPEYMGLTADDAEDLRDAFDAADCGVDTTLEAKCPKCHGYFDFVLPFTGIFLPSKNITKRKKEARRKKRQQRRTILSKDLDVTNGDLMSEEIQEEKPGNE